MHKTLTLWGRKVLVTALAAMMAFPSSFAWAAETQAAQDPAAVQGEASATEDEAFTSEDATTSDENAATDAASPSEDAADPEGQEPEVTADTANAAEPATASADDATETAPAGVGFIGNSFRYVDGQPISTYAGNRVTWKKDGNVYRSSDGEVISGAYAMGIDVSEFQGTIDWARVKAAGVDYVIIRAGYADGAIDSNFIKNVEGARAAGIPFGIYLYSYAWDVASAKDEAAWTLQLLKKAGIDPDEMALPVFYDLENVLKSDGVTPAGVDGNNKYRIIQNPSSTLPQMAKAFCDVVAAAGYTPGVYSFANWWNSYLNSSLISGRCRWVAHFSEQLGSKADIWQRMSSGKVDGISGRVDVNFTLSRDYLPKSGLAGSGATLHFVNEDGSWAKSEWKTVSGDRYYFGEDGYAARYRNTIDGERYYFNGYGVMQTGWIVWQDGSGRSYYDEDGHALSGWQTIDGERYYLFPSDIDHRAARYEHVIDGKRYYFDSASRMYTGLLTWRADGRVSYFDPETGVAATGWQKVGGKTYYFIESTGRSVRYRQEIDGANYYFTYGGVMYTGLLTWTANGMKSYYDAEGKRVSGWQKVGSYWYYFNPADSDNRAVRYEQVLTGRDGETHRYYFDSSYRMYTGLITWQADGRRSYFDPSTGAAVSGWKTVGGKKYYFGTANDRSVRYEQAIGGKRYYFEYEGYAHTGWLTWKKDKTRSYYGSDGVQQTGWITVGSKRYYVNPKTARAVRYRQTISGSNYYFGSDYVMHTGWLKWVADGKWSYFNANGKQLFGTQTINGQKYYFGTSGKTSASPYGNAMLAKAQKYSSATSWMLMCDTTNNYVGVFKGYKGNWDLKYYWRCSSGAPGSGTVLGQFTVTGKGYSFGHGYTCYYYTQFYGDYLFHSVKYYQGTRTIMDGRLGMNISAGCVRLPIDRAKWIYDNIPYGTRVVTYR